MGTDEQGFISAYGHGTLNSSGGFAGIVNALLGLINDIIPVLIAAALALFMYGVVQYIYNRGKKDKRQIILWSLIALFVMVSIWGIIRILQNSLFGTGSSSSAVSNTL